MSSLFLLINFIIMLFCQCCLVHCSSLRMVLDFLPMEEYGEPKDARHHLQGKDNWIGRLFSKSQDIISFQNYMTYVAVNKLDRLKQV